MSSENLGKFYEIVQGDQSLQNQLGALTDGNKFAETAVRLAAERGLTFTVSDVQTSIENVISRSRELSEQELSTVAGGTLTYSIQTGTCTANINKLLTSGCGGMLSAICTGTGGGGSTTLMCTGDPPNC